MKFIYTGEYPEGADHIIQHGHRFDSGAATDVTDEAVIKRLTANRFFEPTEGAKRGRPPGKKPTEAA